MRLLVVAAEEREFRGILAHARNACEAQVGVDWARSVALGEHDLLLVANGAGPARAAATVDRAAAAFRPETIVSTGFCGALDEELDVASVVVATEVVGANGRFGALAPSASLAHHLGVVVTIDHVAQSAAEKRSLRQTGATAVDMEAAAVAGRAAALNLPFFCIKAVTDLAVTLEEDGVLKAVPFEAIQKARLAPFDEDKAPKPRHQPEQPTAASVEKSAGEETAWHS